MQRGRVHRNVASLVDPPAQRRSEVATSRPDRGPAVLSAAQAYRNSARWTVALALGLRQSEPLALQWRDIDLLNNTLFVRRTMHRVKGSGLIFEAPKTKRSARTLALPLPLVAALHVHKARQVGERMLAGSEWQNEDEGIHARVVMALPGHSQMRTTMDIYSHVMPALARESRRQDGSRASGAGWQPVATKVATKKK